MPALILLRNGAPFLTFNLDRAETRVGRGALNDVVIPDDKASRHSFVVTAVAGVFRLLDASGRGVTLNGEPVREAELKDGDEICAGDTRARFALTFAPEGADRNTDVAPAPITDLLSFSPEAGELVVTRGTITIPDGGGRSVTLGPGVTNIGSAEGNQLRLEARYVSGFHCRIYKRGGRHYLRDLDSTNGTMVNGVKVVETELPDGAVIRVGKTELVFHFAKEAQKVVAAAGGSAGVFQGMVGASPAMREVFELLRRIAPSDATVLVTGETGTGKELVAKAIHRLSGRGAQPFIPVNCAAIARDLIESELFGHEKGAFTGAQVARKGAFEEADGGTIFLDEIGEISGDLQSKILRAIEYGEVKKVGASRPFNVNARIVAATNRDLPADVRDGRFREDLYYRLSVIPLRLPSLRERPGDVALIAARIVAEISRGTRTLGAEALRKLEAYAWPGNVRELRNVLTRAIVLAPADRIGPEDVRFEPAVLEDFVASAMTFRPGMTMAEIERTVIMAELERNGGSRDRAAKALGIGLTTLRDKLRAWGVTGKKEEAAG